MRAENVEFFALIGAAGWTAAEAARQLDLDPSVISQYKSDKVKPSPQTLSLLKLILWRDSPGALTAHGALREESMADWERNVLGDLRELHKEDRDKVIAAMRLIIETIPKRESVSYSKHHSKPKKPIGGVSSKIADVATASQASASELAKRELQEQQRKQSAGETSEHKHGRAHGGRKGTGDKPEAQG